MSSTRGCRHHPFYRPLTISCTLFYVLLIGDYVKCARIEYQAKDPRNQAFSSSYSVMESSARRTPQQYHYSKTSEYEPHSNPTTQYKKSLIGTREGDRFYFGRAAEGDDEGDDSGSSFDFTDKNAESFFADRTRDEMVKKAQQAKKAAAAKEATATDESEESYTRPPARKSAPVKKKQKASSSSSSHPKSINEIVEGGAPVQGSSSAVRKSKIKNGGGRGDGELSGKYLSRGRFGDDDSYEEGYDKEKHYDKEAGKKFVEAHKAEQGEKADKGYKHEEGYDKAEEEKHGKEEKKAEIEEKGGEKKGHHEEEKQFGEEYKGHEGEKGISVKKKGGHKKGHKKHGFHKVHHKDEFKKDEVFYDEGHDGDEHEEHAHEHEKHAKEHGGHAKKNHLDSAYHEGHAAKKGHENEGHHYDEASGHKKKAGEEYHHDQHSKYGKKGGVKEGAKFGHAEGGGHEGGYFDDGY